MTLDKPWDQHTAEEREAVRAQKRTESGGEECDECGEEDYEHNMVHHEKRVLCIDCCVDLGIPVPEEEVITGSSIHDEEMCDGCDGTHTN